MSLLVHGVVMNDGQNRPRLPDGVTLVQLRELCAVTEEGDYSVRRAESVGWFRAVAVA